MASCLKPLGYSVVMVETTGTSTSTRARCTSMGMGDPNRCPSSIGEQGSKQLGAYIRSKGLLFGLHTMRGIKQMAIQQRLPVLATVYTADQIVDLNQPCPWVGGDTTAPYARFYSVNMSHPATQTFYHSLYAQYAEYGVDIIKTIACGRITLPTRWKPLQSPLMQAGGRCCTH